MWTREWTITQSYNTFMIHLYDEVIQLISSKQFKFGVETQ